MNLSELQHLFASLLPRLIDEAFALGFQVAVGEVYRPPETVQIYAREGRGSTTSVHPLKLAVDLPLFKDGEYLKNTEEYRELGQYWKSLHPLCRWGGDFKKSDGNHFSVSYQGRA